MEYLFDGVIFSAILFCFIKSSEPKRTALLVCVFVALSGYIINEHVPIQYVFSTQAIMESFGAAYLAYLSLGVNKKNKMFFYLMTGFLVASVLNNGLLMPIYKYANIGTFDIYTYCYQTIAIAHVFTMLAFSNVIGNILRTIRDSVFIWGNSFHNLRG